MPWIQNLSLFLCRDDNKIASISKQENGATLHTTQLLSVFQSEQWKVLEHKLLSALSSGWNITTENCQRNTSRHKAYMLWMFPSSILTLLYSCTCKCVCTGAVCSVCRLHLSTYECSSNDVRKLMQIFFYIEADICWFCANSQHLWTSLCSEAAVIHRILKLCADARITIIRVFSTVLAGPQRNESIYTNKSVYTVYGIVLMFLNHQRYSLQTTYALHYFQPFSKAYNTSVVAVKIQTAIVLLSFLFDMKIWDLTRACMHFLLSNWLDYW